MLALSYLHNGISPIGQRHSRPSLYFVYAEVLPIFNVVKVVQTVEVPPIFNAVKVVLFKSLRLCVPLKTTIFVRLTSHLPACTFGERV